MSEEKKFGFWSSLGAIFNAVGHMANACLPAARAVENGAIGLEHVSKVGRNAGEAFELKHRKESNLDELRADIAKLESKSNEKLRKLGVA